MLKNENIKNYIKLNKTKKVKLTISWLNDLLKTNYLTLNDVKDIMIYIK